MVIVSLHCQMGNQMFQYAFAKAISKEKRTFFLTYLGNKNHPFKLNYFKLNIFTRLVYSSLLVTNLHQIWCRLLKRYFLKTFVDDNWNIGIEQKNNSYYVGYFQSVFYFKSIVKEIKNHFKIKQKYVDEFILKYHKCISQNKIIVIHVRRTDYLDVTIDGFGLTNISLPIDYYNKVLASIEDIEKYEIYFVGDDIDSIKNDFGVKKNYHFEVNSPIIDFQLIQHANIAIIANSTFAWWASFLRINKDNKVFAPNYWLGYGIKEVFPVGIVCDDFQWVDF
jgi:hypothetical protein